MTTRTSSAQWRGDLKSGTGDLALGSGAFSGSYTFASRFENGDGTNLEELIGAANAACFSMWLANVLDQAGHTAESVRTEATVHLEKTDGVQTITRIVLSTVAVVPGLDESTFQEKAEESKTGCVVSRALASVPIELEATLVS